MNREGPILEALTRRLAESPVEFLLSPRNPGTKEDGIDVIAIACDHLRAIDADVPRNAADWFVAVTSPASINRLRLLSLAAWLLHDDWFLQHHELAAQTVDLFRTGFVALAELVKAQDIVKDSDRREEFARLCLKQLGLRPKGETAAQAADRLVSLDSVERVRVTRQTRDAEARARKIREQMARQAAQAAAARYAPE